MSIFGIRKIVLYGGIHVQLFLDKIKTTLSNKKKAILLDVLQDKSGVPFEYKFAHLVFKSLKGFPVSEAVGKPYLTSHSVTLWFLKFLYSLNISFSKPTLEILAWIYAAHMMPFFTQRPSMRTMSKDTCKAISADDLLEYVVGLFVEMWDMSSGYRGTRRIKADEMLNLAQSEKELDKAAYAAAEGSKFFYICLDLDPRMFSAKLSPEGTLYKKDRSGFYVPQKVVHSYDHLEDL